jgi:4-alpha-glucanotransferase
MAHLSKGWPQGRASGVLLHPTCLPGRHGIGDLGAEAIRFVDFLADAGQQIWQILPLGPTGYGHSPYSTRSAFAGNPLLICPEMLVETGDLEGDDLANLAPATAQPIDFPAVAAFKERLLAKAARRFRSGGLPERQQAFDLFCREQADWLEDYALFDALHQHCNGRPWQRWPEELRTRQAQAIAQWREGLDEELHLRRYTQFIFFEQWLRLRHYAHERGVCILGDLPIFVALDSADVWARPELFCLDEGRQPVAVAGVPPDYFSATGQRWGNPLYHWDQHRQEDFAWWRRRVAWNLSQCDLLRIDHFRGFVACWAIPAHEPTAVSGQWWPSPGAELFEALRREFDDLPFIAEDLGIITGEVEELRDRFGLPGMKILQFAFDSGPDNPYLPHNLTTNCVVYTGTHDNDTTLGWWSSLPSARRAEVAAYLGKNPPEMPWDLIRLAQASVARLAVLPLQDLLGLGSSARMNVPGRPSANWSWRLDEEALTLDLQEQLADLTHRFGRSPAKNPG